MHTIELSEAGDIADWATRWDALARAVGGLYFLSSAWVASWWRMVEPDSTMTLLVDGGIDQPIGLFALSALARPVHPRLPLKLPYVGISGSGFGAADGLGPITSDATSARRLLHAAAQTAGHRPLVLSNLDGPHRELGQSLRGAVPVATVRRPGLDLVADGGVPRWPTKLRKNLRRRERRLVEAGFVRRWVRLTPDTADELRQLERLHNLLWASRGSGGLFGPRRMAFFRDLAAHDHLGDEGPWLQLIERDGSAVGALFGFRFGRTFCSYKTGWDPAHHALGLGMALHSAAIGWAADQGVERYDFLRGGTAHKYAFGGVDVVDTTFVVPNGWRGRPLLVRDRLAERRSVAGPD